MSVSVSVESGPRAVLNSADSAPPPSLGNGGTGTVVEHALSISLDQADSLAAPQKPADPSALISQRFTSLADDDTTLPQADKMQSSFDSYSKSDAYTHTKTTNNNSEIEQAPEAELISKSWHPSTPMYSPGGGSVAGGDEAQAKSQAPPPPAPSQPQVASPPTPTKAPAVPPAPPAQVEGSTSAFRMDAAQMAAAARERDIAAAFAGLPRVSPRWCHNYMKILLVGDDGLGKTTFVRNLFAAYASDVDFPVADASAPGAAAVFSSQPDRLCTELVVKDEEAQTWWHYMVQDTPGYGDFEDAADAEAQRDAVLAHVRACSSRYYDAEADAARRVPAHGLADCRVDVCLYFVAPHRLRRADVKYMRQLSAAVPVVPVLAKADSMTAEELEAHRSAVRAALAPRGAMWRFSDSALGAAGATRAPPFAVVGSAAVDRGVGRFWPVRRYPWGRCEPLLTQHSELPALRRLLFESGYHEIKMQTEARYLRFRQKECNERSNPVPRPLRGLLRLAGGVALVTFAAYAAVNAGPLLKDRVVRRETVRRVKAKVGEAVEGAIDTAYEVKDRALEATGPARSSAAAAVDTTKEAARRIRRRAVEALESDEVRAAREEAERLRTQADQQPWWQFWRNGGGLE